MLWFGAALATIAAGAGLWLLAWTIGTLLSWYADLTREEGDD